jgi:hypothetical protein
MTKETGGPAFPTSDWDENDRAYKMHGMTLRQYAAIKLRVPDSGNDWLDKMIWQSQRDEFAAKAMQGLITSRHTDYENGWYDEESVASSAYKMADAMLEAGK